MRTCVLLQQRVVGRACFNRGCPGTHGGRAWRYPDVVGVGVGNGVDVGDGKGVSVGVGDGSAGGGGGGEEGGGG